MLVADYEKYAKLKESAGITDYEVAKQTGISTATLANWKNDRYVPKVDKIFKIASFFNVQIEELLSEKNSDTGEEADD